MLVTPWAHMWLGLGAEVPAALSALGPGLLQLPQPLGFLCLSLSESLL